MFLRNFCREKALKRWVLRENNTAAIQIYSNQPDEMPQQPYWGGEWHQAMVLSMELLNDGNNVSQLGYMANESSGRFATEWMSQSKSWELDHDLCRKELVKWSFFNWPCFNLEVKRYGWLLLEVLVVCVCFFFTISNPLLLALAGIVTNHNLFQIYPHFLSI